MPPQDRDKERFYDDLVGRGIPKDEIERVYQSLRGKGYGEAEARRRSQIALERMRAERELASRRRARGREAGSPDLSDRREGGDAGGVPVDAPAVPVPPAASVPFPDGEL